MTGIHILLGVVGGVMALLVLALIAAVVIEEITGTQQ